MYRCDTKTFVLTENISHSVSRLHTITSLTHVIPKCITLYATFICTMYTQHIDIQRHIKHPNLT